MAIVFKEEGHIYESNDQDKIDWTSVTSFIGMFLLGIMRHKEQLN